jgi:hypothetical protein
MPSRIVYHRAGNVVADGQWELDALDLSWADLLRISVKLTGDSTGTSPTLNIYLQSRGAFGIWNDRAAFPQLVGADNTGEARVLNLSKFGDLSDAEESYEPSGSSGGSRLTAGTVRNGPFPGNYRNKGVGIETAWRFDFDIGGTDTPTFPLELWVEADAAA